MPSARSLVLVAMPTIVCKMAGNHKAAERLPFSAIFSIRWRTATCAIAHVRAAYFCLGVSHQADLHLGQIRGASAFAVFFAFVARGVRAIHSCPHRSHR